MAYSRQNPSPRYLELLGMYQQMHREGDARLNIPAADMFPGQSLPPHAGTIKQLITKFGAGSVLDYGAGKGRQYLPMTVNVPGGGSFASIPAFWGVTVRCYDPAYPPHMALPEGKFDGVVCTDVLEHCPQDDMAWIIDELFSHATRFVFANVACYPARKTLPNGENAHATIQPVAWWQQLFAQASARHGDIAYLVIVEEVAQTPAGQAKRSSAFASPGVLA